MNDSIVVSAPASSANLGPGFDCIGLALDWRNVLTVKPGSGNITIVGNGAEDTDVTRALPRDSSNFVVRLFEQASQLPYTNFDFVCENNIPLARGLGSSTAAAATALIAGWTAAGENWDEERLFCELATIDGHADNAGACTHGGCVLATIDADGVPHQTALPIDNLTNGEDPLAPLFLIPNRELATVEARNALPDSYSRDAAVRAVGNAAFLVAALMHSDYKTLKVWLESDIIHEPAREQLVPELILAREAAAESGALGATLSGAGPTVMVWSTRSVVERTALAIRDRMQASQLDGNLCQLDISTRGASQIPLSV